MARFNFQRFLSETGVSLARLAAYLRVAQSYLEAAAAGRERLTARDLAACRLLWRRLTQAVQIELPFAEPPETFMRGHARILARSRPKILSGRPGDRTLNPGRPDKRDGTKSGTAGRKLCRPFPFLQAMDEKLLVPRRVSTIC